MESKYVENSYKSVERNSNPLELIYTDIYDMKLTPSHGGKKYLLLLLRIALEMTVYMLNCKDEAIEMSRQFNIEVENQCKKIIRSDKNGEYKSHCAEICLESEISNYYHIHLNLMKNRTLKEIMNA